MSPPFAWIVGLITAAVVGVAVGVAIDENGDDTSKEPRCRDELSAAERLAVRTPPRRRHNTPARWPSAPTAFATYPDAKRVLTRLEFEFDGDRRPIVRRQVLTVPRGVATGRVKVTIPLGDIVAAGDSAAADPTATPDATATAAPASPPGGRPLAARHVGAYVTQRGPNRLVTIAVCVNPPSTNDLSTGEYAGAALVSAGRHMKRQPFHLVFTESESEEQK